MAEVAVASVGGQKTGAATQVGNRAADDASTQAAPSRSDAHTVTKSKCEVVSGAGVKQAAQALRKNACSRQGTFRNQGAEKGYNGGGGESKSIFSLFVYDSTEVGARALPMPKKVRWGGCQGA
jgi:hypothetical protein